MAYLSENNSNDNKYLYNENELNADHNLYWYHYGARYYDPQLGRWMAVDPADEFYSPYLYCGNNPIRFTDQDGSEETDVILDRVLAIATYNPLTKKYDDPGEYIRLSLSNWRDMYQEKCVVAGPKFIKKYGDTSKDDLRFLNSPTMQLLQSGHTEVIKLALGVMQSAAPDFVDALKTIGGATEFILYLGEVLITFDTLVDLMDKLDIESENDLIDLGIDLKELKNIDTLEAKADYLINQLPSEN